MARKADFITLSRTAIRDLMAVLNEIKALKREYDGQGASSWIVQADFAGDNADIQEADFENALGNAAALDAYVSAQNYDDTFFKIF